MPKVPDRPPLIGSMKGTLRVAPGTDLTEPADPCWGMDLPGFRGSLAEQEPPRGMLVPLQALWWAAKGDWDKAHAIAQSDDGADAAWVHAYLHRVEGDPDNAGYWYRRAGRSPATGSHEAEWEAIARVLLGTTG